MKHLLLPALGLLMTAASASAATPWTAVQDIADFTTDARYAIGYSNPKGVWKANGDVMSFNLAPQDRGFYAISDCDMTATALNTVPAEAAIVRLEDAGNGLFNIYLTNGPKTGYLVPLDGKNGITVSETPVPVKITLGKGPADDSLKEPLFTTSVRYQTASDDDRSDFSWVNTAVNYEMTHVFWVCMQAESGGQLFFYKEDPTAAPTQTYKATPEAGAYDEYPAVTLTFDGVSSIKIAEGAKATLTLGGYTFDFSLSAEGNALTLTPQEAITAYSGAFTPFILELPEGAVTLVYGENEYPNEAITINSYSVNPPTFSQLDIVDAPEVYTSVSELSSLEFAYTDPYTLDAVNTRNPLTITGQNFGAYGTLNVTGTEEKSFTATVQWTTPEEEIVSDLYVVTIPAEAIVVSNGYGYIFRNDENINFELTLDLSASVDSFEADSTVTVFSATGICLMRNAAPEALETLPAGLYIVNGRKLIRK